MTQTHVCISSNLIWGTKIVNTKNSFAGKNRKLNKKIIKNKIDKRHLYAGKPKLNQRKVERPSYEQLISEIKETNYCAVSRKYGVSDQAIRKWVKFYEKKRI